MHAAGEIHAVGARIGGRLNLNGATITNPNGAALDLDQADIASGVFAGAGITAEGVVRAVGARIGGQLRLSGATFTNPNGIALGLDTADIASDLNAREIHAAGAVRAIGARIGGQLNLDGAVITNPRRQDPDGAVIGGLALTLDLADIGYGLLAGYGFTASGEVRAVGARIGGQTLLIGAILNNPNGDAFVAEPRPSSSSSSVLRWSTGTST